MKLLTFILCLFALPLSGQLVDNFDDKSFPEGPTWVGDVSDFIVNDDLELQLNTDGSGTSAIYSTIDMSPDTMLIGLRFNLKFDPSGSNTLTIALAVDNQDLTQANGYILEMGQTGSDDNIKFYRLDEGNKTPLGEGISGGVAKSPNVRLSAQVDQNGLWLISTDYDGGRNFNEEIVVSDDTYKDQLTLFGLACKYTSSRSSSYYFDDVTVKAYEPDTTPPSVVSVTTSGPKSLLIEFDEAIDINSIETEHVSLSANPVVIVVPTSSTGIEVAFKNEFPSDGTFQVTVEGFRDLAGNELNPETFNISYARLPRDGDVLINEILFAANDKMDFVELINTTEDNLDLGGMILGNNTKDDDEPILAGTLLPPKGHLAITENKAGLIEQYEPIAGALIVEQDIPSFNNDAGNVYIAKADGTVLDSYDYSEDAHLELLSTVKGVSLERTSTTLASDSPEAWSSAARDVNWATPGYANSAKLGETTVDETFEFVQKVFSPDGDNVDDKMLLGYNLEKPGYIANIKILDVGGFHIKTLAASTILSSQGLISWNGLDENGNVANVGMYIIVGEVYHSDGEVKRLKKVCVLAGQLD